MINFLKKILRIKPKCQHEPTEWFFYHFGMGKIRWCKKCNKVLDMI